MQESREDGLESQQKSIHSSHGSLFAAALAAKANMAANDGMFIFMIMLAVFLVIGTKLAYLQV